MSGAEVDFIGAAAGALLLLGSLFGFALLSERLFVTRREWQLWTSAVSERLDAIVRELEHLSHHRSEND